MRITKCSVVLLLAVCLSYPALADKDKEPSNTWQASCIVTIDANPDVYPVHGLAFETLISSSGVAKKAYRDVLKSECNDIWEVLQVELLGVSTQKRPVTPWWSQISSRPPSRKPSETKEVSEVRGYGGGRRSRSSTSSRSVLRPSSAQNYSSVTSQMFKLEVRFPNDDPEIKPLAEEFLAAVIENMEDILKEIYIAQRNLLDGPSVSVQLELHKAKLKFEGLTDDSPASKAIKKQLDMTVDVSKLKSDTPIYEALDMLSKSVKPALPLTVMWKDLSDNAFIENEEPIGIDGQNLTAVRLGTALDLVLKSVGAGLTKLGYAIEGGILIIATSEQLPVPVSSIPVESLGILQETRHDLARKKANFELEIAEQEAFRLAIIKQIAKVSDDMERKMAMDDITDQLHEILQMRSESLRRAKSWGDAAAANAAINDAVINQAKIDLAKAKIDLARRRQEVGKEAGGNKINELNDRLGDIAVDVSVRKSMYEVIKKQLSEVDAKLAAISKSESKRSAIEAAKKALATAEHKVAELKRQEANLKMPVVTVIGAN